MLWLIYEWYFDYVEGNNKPKRNMLKHIVVYQENYDRLKRLGFAGDSFNDVLTSLLKKTEVRD